MNRQELIQSLPFWLRERADGLLRHDAETLRDMWSWGDADEGICFWNRCNGGKFYCALVKLRGVNPEVYQKYYAKYFDMEDSQFEDPNSTQVGGNHYKNMVIQPIDFVLKNNLDS